MQDSPKAGYKAMTDRQLAREVEKWSRIVHRLIKNSMRQEHEYLLTAAWMLVRLGGEVLRRREGV